MMRTLPLLCAALLLTGCPPWIAPSERGGPEIAPLTDDIAGALDACEGDPGGTAYLLGELGVDDEEVVGLEQIAIFANTALIAEGGADCVHTFDSSGEVAAGASGTELTMTWLWSAEQSNCQRKHFFVPEETSHVWTIEPYEEGPIQVLGPTGESVALGSFQDDWIEYASAGYCVRRQEEPSGGMQAADTTDRE